MLDAAFHPRRPCSRRHSPFPSRGLCHGGATRRPLPLTVCWPSPRTFQRLSVHVPSGPFPDGVQLSPPTNNENDKDETCRAEETRLPGGRGPRPRGSSPLLPSPPSSNAHRAHIAGQLQFTLVLPCNSPNSSPELPLPFVQFKQKEHKEPLLPHTYFLSPPLLLWRTHGAVVLFTERDANTSRILLLFFSPLSCCGCVIWCRRWTCPLRSVVLLLRLFRRFSSLSLSRTHISFAFPYPPPFLALFSPWTILACTLPVGWSPHTHRHTQTDGRKARVHLFLSLSLSLSVTTWFRSPFALTPSVTSSPTGGSVS